MHQLVGDRIKAIVVIKDRSYSLAIGKLVILSVIAYRLSGFVNCQSKKVPSPLLKE